MQITVMSYSILSALQINVSQAQLDPTDNSTRYRQELHGSVQMPDSVLNGSLHDQVAFLAECLLDMAYDRG